MSRIFIQRGDITQCTTDAIVNAANTSLLGGGGVDGAIHTPGPIWRGGHAGEAVLLAGCYQNCLRIASELNCKTVAFPSISTGVYRFPLNRAAEIAIRTIEEYLSTHAEIEQVSMICFDGTTLSAYQNALSEREANHV